MKPHFFLSVFLTASAHLPAAIVIGESGFVGVSTATKNRGTGVKPYAVDAYESETSATSTLTNIVGVASLTSYGSISGARLTENLRSRADSNAGWDISVTDAVIMSLSGSLTLSGSGADPQFSLRIGDGNVSLYDTGVLTSSGNFSADLYLAPGHYNIYSIARDNGNYTDTFSYSASITPVPEPSSSSLALIGIAFLFAPRRRMSPTTR